MKKQVRVIGVDDSSFNRFEDGEVLVIGTIFRGGDFMDGCLSTWVDRDGDDSTDKIIAMINNSRFRGQLQAIFLDGIAVGGFNIVDVNRLHKETKKPVIVVVRNNPDVDCIKQTLKNIGMEHKVKLLEKAGGVTKVKDIYVQLTGIELEEAKELLSICTTHSMIPECIRVAHLIGAGIMKGESRGRA